MTEVNSNLPLSYQLKEVSLTNYYNQAMLKINRVDNLSTTNRVKTSKSIYKFIKTN